MPRLLGFLLLAATLTVGGPARADDPDPSPFGDAAAKAQRVRKLDRMVWALTATCEQGDDLARRQCRILRDGAAARLRGATLLVDVPPGAFEVGAFDATKKSSALTLRGCVSCAGVEVDGKTWYVVSNKAAAKVDGGKVVAAVIHETARPFKDEAAALAWRTQVVPRLRTQMIVKVPEKKATWQQGGVQGLAVEIVGFRVYDTCDGSIVCASPESGPGTPDKKACGKTIVESTGGGTTKVVETVVAELDKDQILAGIKPAVDEAKACFDTYGVAGTAKVKITIGADGTVLSEEQKGPFVGTPTGGCIDTAIKKATFPKSKKAKTTISYPIVLQ